MTEIHPKTGKLPWPPMIYLVAILIAIALGLLRPLPWIGGLVEDLLFAVGLLLLLAVVSLWVSAFRTMTRTKTTLNPNGVPSHLITTGPFSLSRNPLYLANTLLLVAIALVGGLAWFLPMALLAGVATTKLAIEREEKVLAERFGKRYRDYAKRVRRWI